MLWHKKTHKTISWANMGRECTGKAQIKATGQLNPLDKGPQQMAPCRGGAPCLYYKANIVAEIKSWSQGNPVHSNKGPLPDGASAQGEKVPCVEPIN